MSQVIALQIVADDPDSFRPGFYDWLENNWPLFERFEQQALHVADTGKRHYSAHRIIEALRLDTSLQDADKEFKVSEKWTSSMARLFARRHPALADLLKFRAGTVVPLPLHLGVSP